MDGWWILVLSIQFNVIYTAPITKALTQGALQHPSVTGARTPNESYTFFYTLFYKECPIESPTLPILPRSPGQGGSK